MQRGILELTLTESQLALRVIEKAGVNLPTLTQRLGMAVSDGMETSTIEVDREEVESLLDALPMPSENEEQEFKNLRGKLSQFISQQNKYIKRPS